MDFSTDSTAIQWITLQNSRCTETPTFQDVPGEKGKNYCVLLVYGSSLLVFTFRQVWLQLFRS